MGDVRLGAQRVARTWVWAGFVWGVGGCEGRRRPERRTTGVGNRGHVAEMGLVSLTGFIGDAVLAIHLHVPSGM